MSSTRLLFSSISGLEMGKNCVTDLVCFCRYSEILDYHNVEDASNSQAMEDFTNGH